MSESGGKQRLAKRQLSLDAKLIGLKTTVLQKFVADTPLINKLSVQLWPPVSTKRDFHLGFGVSDVNNVIAKIIDPPDGEFSFLIDGARCPDASLNIGARIFCHRDKLILIPFLDFVEVPDTVLDSRDLR